MCPFITQERRKLIDPNATVEVLETLQPGDCCYLLYKEMVDRWKIKPGWTTAHEIYKEVSTATALTQVYAKDLNDIIAYNLAWQVFFQLWVMPYELKKREENGDI